MRSTFTAKSSDIAEIGWFGLMLPFLLVFAAVAIFGNHTPQQIAETGWLIVLPIAIMFLRRRAHQTR